MPLIAPLKQIPDPRHRRGQRHPLWMILLLRLLGFLCDYSGYRPLADFCGQQQDGWRAWLGLSDSQPMPSDSTFRPSFVAVAPQGWVEGFNAWAGSTLPPLSSLVLSMNGKSIRCTSTGGKPNVQTLVTLVSVYEQSLGVVRLAMMQNQKAQVAQAHYRRVTRAAQVFRPPPRLKAQWQTLAVVGMVKRHSSRAHQPRHRLRPQSAGLDGSAKAECYAPGLAD